MLRRKTTASCNAKTMKKGFLPKINNVRSNSKKEDKTSDTFRLTQKKIETIPKEFSLSIIEGEPTAKGPKVFENQIFLDVFDSSGKHDKVLENENSVELFKDFEQLKAKYCLVQRFKHFEEAEPVGDVKAKCFDFSSVQLYQHQGLDNTMELIKPLGVRRHLYSEK